MPASIVITGIGMVTPLGLDPWVILRRAAAGESAAAPPTGFDAAPFACRVCAQVRDFQPQQYVSEPKLLRLMNPDARFAVAAAHRALRDAGL
jgi:3-oxoacyl-[acyl-carrier-protein] synthase II